MLRKLIPKVLLALALFGAILLLGVLPVRAEWIAAEHTRSTGSPYYIMVNCQMNTLTIYTLDENGYYTKPFKAMICSTGRQGHATPHGTFSLTGYKNYWTHMIDGSYGQYVSQFKGSYLIHSVCYTKADPSTLMTEEYNMLGSVASLGCVRLQVADAKWIFDNCPAGTRVTVYDSADPGPLGKPEKLVDYITEDLDNGWEPTDQREENPWRARYVSSVALDKTELSLEAGDKAELSLLTEPDGAFLPREVTWTSADPTVAIVDGRGAVFGVGAGVTEITVSRGNAVAACIVSVTGERLPFADIPPNEWYYRDIRYAYENHLLLGTGDGLFLPDAPVTAAMAAQALRNLSGVAQDDGGDGKWYESAFLWAVEHELVEADFPIEVFAEQPVSRQAFIGLLYRYSNLLSTVENADTEEDENTETASLDEQSEFGDTNNSDAPAEPNQHIETHEATDVEQISDSIEAAILWALANGLLQGAEHEDLMLDDTLTRAQLAAVLGRYERMSK